MANTFLRCRSGASLAALLTGAMLASGASNAQTVLQGELSDLTQSTGFAKVANTPVVLGRDLASDLAHRKFTGSEVCVLGRSDASGLFWVESIAECRLPSGQSSINVSLTQSSTNGAASAGIVGTGVQGIVGTGVQGIVGTGVQGIVGTGVQGIVGTGR